MIRLGTMDDCRAVYLLICELEDCELNYADFERIYGGMMHRGDFYSVLIAQKGDEVLGEATLRFEDHLHHCEKIAEIMELSVTAKHRSCGIGSAIFEEACKLAKSRGCTRMEVSSNRARERAHRFYERLGMVNSHFKFCKPL